MSAISGTRNSFEGARYINKLCGCGKRASIRICENARNKNKLYYTCENGVCSGFLGWCLPMVSGCNSESVERMAAEERNRDNNMQISAIKNDIQTLKDENKMLYDEMMHLESVVRNMKVFVSIALGFVILMFVFVFIILGLRS